MKIPHIDQCLSFAGDFNHHDSIDVESYDTSDRSVPCGWGVLPGYLYITHTATMDIPYTGGVPHILDICASLDKHCR